MKKTTVKNEVATIKTEVATVKNEVATVEKNKKSVKPIENKTKNNIVFSLRGAHSYRDIMVKYGLKQYTCKSHDATQLIFSGKSSINLRRKKCFINATDIDFELLKNSDLSVELLVNGNSVDNIRPHKIYFDLSLFENVCECLSHNALNKNGFDLI